MKSQNVSLLEKIEDFCRKANIAESTFGYLVVNDGKLCSRLRNGKDVTMNTANKIQMYIDDNKSSLKSSENNELSISKLNTPIENFDEKSKNQDISKKDKPFRFFDNRQKYLSFVNTCNEKWKIAERAAEELKQIQPNPPAFRLFDAGVGDGTLLCHMIRAMHRLFPTMPFFLVGKEISLEDVRLCLEKLPDRFVEHPANVIVLTNLYYSEAPWLKPVKSKTEDLFWKEVQLEGNSSFEFGEQLRMLDQFLVEGWQTVPGKKTGNPTYVRPSVLVLYRADHRFLLDSIIPKKGEIGGEYDLLLASQPWRNQMDLDFKIEKILSPLTLSLRKGGRLFAVQSYGNDPATDLINQIWDGEKTTGQNRHELINGLKKSLGQNARMFNFNTGSDARSVFSYHMHTLPEEISTNIGTSTLFAAWNAAIYAAQIEDEKLESVISNDEYLKITERVLKKYGGLWFNDESFIVSRKRN